MIKVAYTTGVALDMTGGTLNATTIQLGTGSDSEGTFNVSGGTVTADTMTVGFSGQGTLNVSGASTVVDCGQLRVTSSSGSGYVNINGGKIQTDELKFNYGGFTYSPDKVVNIAGGTLEIDGNDVAAVNAAITNEWIIAYDYRGTVNVDYNSVTDKTVVTATPELDKAYSPYPSDEADYIDPNTITLSWAPGDGAVYHDLYIGTDYNSVLNADHNSPEFQGTLDTNSYSPNSLSANNIYYWVVDEVNGASVVPGNIWSFSTEVYQQYRVTELVFEANYSYTDPINDVNLTCEFSGPNSTDYTITGFWDGDSTWRIRFMPTLAGNWTYQTCCPNELGGPNDPGLDNQTGSFNAIAASGSNPLYAHGGLLSVSADNHYLTYTDGTPFFWLGDTWWYCPGHYMPFKGSSNPEIASCFKHCLAKRKSQGYSVIHFSFLGSLNGYVGPNAFYTDPQIHVEYWQAFDEYMDYIIEQGIMPYMAMAWSDDNTLDQWKIIWKYFVARYGAYPITWDFLIEYNAPSKWPPGGDYTLAFGLGQFIKDIDPYKRAMSIMPWYWAYDDHEAWDEPWHDFVELQGGHEDPYSMPIDQLLEPYNETPAFPSLLLETVFEGIQRYETYPPYEPNVVRRCFYRSMQCGGAGLIYGSHGLWYPTQNENDTMFEEIWGESIPWWQALERPAAGHMGHLKTFYESVDWWQLAPDVDAVTAGGITDPNLYILTRDGVIDSNNVYLIYFPPDVSATESATLTAVNGNYTATWFDPRTADTNTLPNPLTVSGGTLTLPDRSDSDDWMLKLVQQ
jgi:hypothetical protein